MRNKKGFTAVEMVLTLAIAAIIITLTINMGRSISQRSNIDAFTSKFVGDYYYARQLAARENRYIAILFDTENRKDNYKIYIHADLTKPPSDETFRETDEENYAWELVKEKDLYVQSQHEGVHEYFDVTTVTDLVFSPSGLVHAWPVQINSDPINITLTFFKLDRLTGQIDYKRKLYIYPTGGLRIERQKTYK